MCDLHPFLGLESGTGYTCRVTQPEEMGIDHTCRVRVRGNPEFLPCSLRLYRAADHALSRLLGGM